MKKLFLISIITIFACASIDRFEFRTIKCASESMPGYDSILMTVLDENQYPIRDSLIKTIEKRRTVFKPCREMIYNAVFKNEDGDVLSKNRIKMMATGKRWEVQPELQDEIIVQYEFTSKDFDLCREQQLNTKLLSRGWTYEITTGIIENVEEVWMHPFRQNQYNFTEVAPFPHIKMPIQIGKSWSGGLSLGSGWGDWENTEISTYYEVKNRESIKTKYGQVDDCWKIESESDFFLGKSQLVYWFHEELGFVRLEYLNYGNQTLEISLAEVNEE